MCKQDTLYTRRILLRRLRLVRPHIHHNIPNFPNCRSGRLEHAANKLSPVDLPNLDNKVCCKIQHQSNTLYQHHYNPHLLH